MAWYPDKCFIIRGSVIDIPLFFLSHDDFEDSCKPGNSTTIEAKVAWNDDKIKQLIATAIVASFTEKRLHNKLLKLVLFLH